MNLPKPVKSKITKLSPYPGNPRIHDLASISESLEANGQYRPLVVQQSTGYVLAGNGTLKAAKQLGWDSVLVQHIDVDDETAKRIVLADNRTTQLGAFDDAALAALLKDVSDLKGTGYDSGAVAKIINEFTEQLGGDPENPYTATTNPLQYEVKGEVPEVGDVYDATRTEQLRDAITSAGVPDEVRDFLWRAAERHTVFNYQRIAEYYAAAPAEIQELIEQSVLVIIDYDDAKRLGYVRLSERLDELEAKDRASRGR